jgi:hypothetical protein
MRALWVRILLLCGAAILAAAFGVSSQVLKTDSPMEYPMTTENRVHSPGWWPTKGTPAREEFVGEAVCAKCHSNITRGIQTSRDRPGKACPVGVKACVTCHMPPAEIASMHAPFTDHRIRIAREGEPFRTDRKTPASLLSLIV